MTGSLVLRAVLGDPPFDVTLSPDAPGCERGDRLGESVRAGQLLGPLLAHPESLSNLGHSHQVHAMSLACSLDTVKPSCHTSLDNVKREEA